MTGVQTCALPISPTIAFDCGSVKEVMQEGLTGFIVEDMDQAVAAVAKISTIERTACRNVFEKRFTAAYMAENYLDLYQSMIGNTVVSPRSQAIA